MYKVDVDQSASKSITQLPPKHKRQVVERIDSLAKNPLPPDSTALKARTGGYSVDSGENRILYVIDDSKEQVSVFRVKHGREAYR